MSRPSDSPGGPIHSSSLLSGLSLTLFQCKGITPGKGGVKVCDSASSKRKIGFPSFPGD